MSQMAGRDVFRLRGFLLYWTSYTVSGFGTYVTTLALQVLILVDLGGTVVDVGLLNAARWLPYLLLGLIVGALVDRRRRRPHRCRAGDSRRRRVVSVLGRRHLVHQGRRAVIPTRVARQPAA